MVTKVITETEMYWLTRLTGVHNGICGIGIVLITMGIIGLIIGAVIWHEDEIKKWFFIGLATFVLGVLLSFSSVFIPTTKEMCAIKAIPAIASNKQVQEIPDKVMDLADAWIKELSPNKDSE